MKQATKRILALCGALLICLGLWPGAVTVQAADIGYAMTAGNTYTIAGGDIISSDPSQSDNFPPGDRPVLSGTGASLTIQANAAGGIALADNATITGTLTAQDNTKVNLGNNVSMGGVWVDAGKTLTLEVASGERAIIGANGVRGSGTLVKEGAGTLALPGNVDVSVAGVELAAGTLETSGIRDINAPLSGSGALRAASGILGLYGDNSGYSGPITAESGALLVATNSSALGTGPVSVTGELWVIGSASSGPVGFEDNGTLSVSGHSSLSAPSLSFGQNTKLAFNAGKAPGAYQFAVADNAITGVENLSAGTNTATGSRIYTQNEGKELWLRNGAANATDDITNDLIGAAGDNAAYVIIGTNLFGLELDLNGTRYPLVPNAAGTRAEVIVPIPANTTGADITWTANAMDGATAVRGPFNHIQPSIRRP